MLNRLQQVIYFVRADRCFNAHVLLVINIRIANDDPSLKTGNKSGAFIPWMLQNNRRPDG